MSLSVGRTGSCHDNAVAESFFGTLKNEIHHRRKRRTRLEAALDDRQPDIGRGDGVVPCEDRAEAGCGWPKRRQASARSTSSTFRRATGRGCAATTSRSAPTRKQSAGRESCRCSRPPSSWRGWPASSCASRTMAWGKSRYFSERNMAELCTDEPAPLSGQRKGPRGAGGGGREDDYGEPRPCRPSGRVLGQGRVLDLGDSTESPHHGPVTPTFPTLPPST